MVDYAPNLNEIRQARDKYKTVIQECYEYLNTIKSSRDYYIVQRYISKLEKQLKELEKLLFLQRERARETIFSGYMHFYIKTRDTYTKEQYI